MFACITLTLLSVEISEAFDAPLSTTYSTIFVMLVDRGVNRAMEDLSRAEFTPLLCTTLLSLSLRSNDRPTTPNLWRAKWQLQKEEWQ